LVVIDDIETIQFRGSWIRIQLDPPPTIDHQATEQSSRP
jgi:hypothetical protein